jgi:hypothetical protein
MATSRAQNARSMSERAAVGVAQPLSELSLDDEIGSQAQHMLAEDFEVSWCRRVWITGAQHSERRRQPTQALTLLGRKKKVLQLVQSRVLLNVGVAHMAEGAGSFRPLPGR